MHLTLLVSSFCSATMMAIEIDSASKAVFEKVHNPSQTMASMFHKTFHQCSMDKSCCFVIKDVKSQNFYRLTDHHDIPAEKSHLIIWFKKQSGILGILKFCKWKRKNVIYKRIHFHSF